MEAKMKQQLHHLVQLLILVTLLSPLQELQAKEMISRKLSYSITCSDIEVGSVYIKASKNSHLKTLDVITKLNLSKFGDDYIFLGRNRTEDIDGELSLFDHWLAEGKERWHLSGKRVDRTLFVSANKVHSRDQKDLKELTSLAATFGSYTIPHAATVISVMELFSSVESEGEEAVPLDSSDTTDHELHEHLMKMAPWKEIKKLRVFYTETLEHKNVHIRYLGKQNLITPPAQFITDGFEIKTNKEVTQVWLTRDNEWGVIPVLEKTVVDKVEFVSMLQSIE